MVGGPTVVEEEYEVTEDGFPLTYDGMGAINHFFFVGDPCEASDMDWSAFLTDTTLDWMIIPCETRLSGSAIE